MSNEELRWQQRFNNFSKALNKLTEAVEFVQNKLADHDIDIEDEKSENILYKIVRDGLIQRFQYTHELAWNVIKDYFEYQGNTSIKGSRDAIREAFTTGLIDDGEVWMDTIRSRVQTVHAYDENTASEIAEKVMKTYFPVFVDFKNKMENIIEKN